MTERSPEALEAPPPDFYDALDEFSFDSESREVSEALAASYLQAFEDGKAERRRALRRIRENLDAGPVVVSAFNWGFRHLVENWAASCDHHGIDCRAFTLLFPMDEGADRVARELGFQSYFDGASYGDLPSEAATVFGDDTFRKCLFGKLAATQDMLEIDADVLRQDVDMVWLRDPRPYLIERMDRGPLDFLFMDDGPNPLYKPLHFNSGFVYIRNNPFSRYAWNLLFSNYARIFRSRHEQSLINMIMNFLRDRGLRCDRLPEEVFVNGHIISKAMDEELPLPESPVVLHFSWTENLERKLAHLTRSGHWYI